MWIPRFCLFFVAFIKASKSLDLGSCNYTLGLGSGDIKDHQLEASSAFDTLSTGPQNARLHKEIYGGAWCPKNTIREGVKEWLRVDLKEEHVVTTVVTQGRYGKGTGREYLRQYILEYKRYKGEKEWRVYRDIDGNEIMEGNKDTVTPVYRNLNPPIFAVEVRIVPYSDHPRVVCLRFELHGCKDESGLRQYMATPPDEGGGSDHRDRGILFDGSYATDRAPGWLSWKRKGSRPVEFIFEFDRPRQFTRLLIFTSNRFTYGKEVFKRAIIWFSVGGQYYREPPLTFEYVPDEVLEDPRNVSIPLKDNVGQFLKVNLIFNSNWISVSEINFESLTVSKNYSLEDEPPLVKNESKQIPFDIIEEEPIYEEKEVAEEVEMATSDIEMEILVGVLTAVTLLLLFLFIAVLLYSRRQKFLNSPTSRSLNPFPEINMKDLLLNVSPTTVNDPGVSVNVAISAVNSGSSVEESGRISLNNDEGFLSFYDQYRTPLFEESRPKWHSASQLPEVSKMRMAAGLRSSSVTSEYASVDVRNIAERESSSSSNSNKSSNFRTLGAGYGGETRRGAYNLGHFFPRVSSDPPCRKSYSTSSREIKNLPTVETSWNLTTSAQIFSKQQGLTLREISKGQLRLKESLGPGVRGEIILCEIDTEYSNVPSIVAVRARNGSDSREDFLRECRLLSSFNHPNVVSLFGVMIESPRSVVEHSTKGDLYTVLRSSPGEDYVRLLTYGSQIAAGMKYLQSRNIVHRDLAARNCILSENNVVKISDVAQGIMSFKGDYSEVKGQSHAPIRWQPWESVLLGRITGFSNVWSYGVSLWEIFSLCRERPFPFFTDVEVVKNAEHIYYNDPLRVELSKPEICEKEVWELLQECWSKEETSRPTFSEINIFLKRRLIALDA